MDVQRCKTLGCPGTFDATAPQPDEIRWCCAVNGINRHGQMWKQGWWSRLDGTKANGSTDHAIGRTV